MTAQPVQPVVQLVPLRGRFVNEMQRPLAGQTILFTPRAKVRHDTDALVTVVGGSVRVEMDDDGRFDILLAATDDPDVIPTNWTWHVKEEWLGGRSYDIPVPLAGQALGIDLTQVAPAPASGGVGWEIGPAGPAGPPGPPGASTDTQVDEAILTHVNDPEPHPAYDDAPDFTLLFENGLV